MALLQIFDERILPWADDRKPRIVVAGRLDNTEDLPAGVSLTKKKPRGPRKALKGPRDLDRVLSFSAEWPREGLIETSAPLLICVCGGRIDFWAGETEVHCAEGHFLIIPPGLPHERGARPHYHYDSETANGREFCDLLWFGRWGRIIRCWTCHSQGAKHNSKPGEQADFLSDVANQLLDLLFDEAESGRPERQALCNHYLHAFFEVLARDLREDKILKQHRSEPLDSLPDNLLTGEETDPVQRAQNYMRTHLREALTIEKVARHVYMSRSHFTRLFRQKTGKSFTQYLTECRLDEAKLLLRDSSWSIKRIAQYVGLRSSSYFTQLFTNYTGTTPRDFRSGL